MTDRRQVAAGERGSEISIPKLLYAFLGAPVLWALHLNVSYFLLTLDCISTWSGGRWAIVISTILFAAASAAAGWLAWRLRRRLGGKGLPGSERDWATFLLVLGIGSSVIFTAAIVLEGVSPLLADLCA